MKLFVSYKIFLVLFAIQFSCFANAQTVLFAESFSNATLWPTSSGVTSIKTVDTPYGTVKYLNLAIYNATKTYFSISNLGYLDFRAGSSTIGATNSYIELPACNFINGGEVEIVYGAGSTGKKLRLQEWTGSAWSNSTYAEVSTVKSSTWYTQKWLVSGTGSKIFRVVQSAAASIFLADITITTNQPVLSLSTNSLSFDSIKANAEVQIISASVSGSFLTGDIILDVNAPFKVSKSIDGVYSSNVSLPQTGGLFYIKYEPITAGTHSTTLVVSSTDAVSKIITLNGSSFQYRTGKVLKSFSCNGFQGVIDSVNRIVNIVVPWNYPFPIISTPSVVLSQDAVLLPAGNLTFNDGEAQQLAVQAEDGSLATYTITISRSSADKECSFSEFILAGKRAKISSDTLEINLPNNIDLSSLTAFYTCTGTAKVKQSDNVAKDFSIQQSYTVLSKDGTAQKIYYVKLNLLDAIYTGPFPYFSNMTSTYGDPMWISGGGLTAQAAFQPYLKDDGVCKDSLGIYMLSEAVDAGNEIKMQVSSCGRFTVGVSADGIRKIELSNNQNSVKDTISMNSYNCTYGSIDVNSFGQTDLFIKVLSGGGSTSVFYFEITQAIATDISSVQNEKVKVYTQNDCIVIDALPNLPYSIYSVQGELLHEDRTQLVPAAFSVKPGLYIVRIGSSTFKVLVTK